MLLLLESIPYILVFLLGTVIGSFLNVCICRLPLKQSVVTAPSHCMSCGSRLAWYDMVPVFSWLVLGGKCRNCKAKISVQYPIVEAVNGILYVTVCTVYGLTRVSLIYCLMVSALLTLSVIDWRTYEIPVGINLFLGVLGAAATALDPEHFISHLIGAVCVSGFLLVLYLLTKGRAIGGGDVKLMAACGLILGWQRILLAFFIGCIAGSVIHLIRMKLSGEGPVLAMGPYLSLGIFTAALWGESWIQWYFSVLGI